MPNDIKINVPQAVGEIKQIEAASEDLQLKKLQVNISSQSPVMDKLVKLFDSYITVLNTYQTALIKHGDAVAADIEKTKQAVIRIKTIDDQISRDMK